MAMRARGMTPRALALVATALLLGGCEPPPEVAVWERFEAVLPVDAAGENPFDPEAVDVVAEFRTPQGEILRTPAFVYRPYAQSEAGDGSERLAQDGPLEWRVRFTPGEPGDWAWRWLHRSRGQRVAEADWKPLAVAASEDPRRHGFLRVSPDDPRYLRFDDGAPIFAVGENLAWYDGRGSFAYDDWLAKLAAEGVTYVRLWMPSWAMGLVYAPAELFDWSARLERAWQLDRVLATAERHGIYVMLSVQNHGPFELGGFFGSEWDTNLYNTANGGPLSHPSEVFADPVARQAYRNYLRYVVARWGYAPHVLGFELWNEADLVEQPADFAEVVAWHREMARELRGLDPNRHLVSTSTSDELMMFKWWLDQTLGDNYPLSFEPVWALPEIDFTQVHAYQIGSLQLKVPVHRAFPDLVDRMRLYGKPVLVAEAGVDFQGPAETLQADPQGEGFHDILWAGIFAGGFGTSMPWWWDNVVDPEDRYFHFGAIAAFVEGVAFDREGFARRALPVDAPGRDVVAHVLAGRTTLLAWLKNADHEYWHPDRAPVEGARLTLPALPEPPGEIWRGRWLDPWTGETLDELILEAGGGEPVVEVPTFSRDAALRLERDAD